MSHDVSVLLYIYLPIIEDTTVVHKGCSMKTIDNMKKLALKPDSELLNLMKEDYGKIDNIWKATKAWNTTVENLFKYFQDPDNVLNFRSATIKTGISTSNPTNFCRIPKPSGLAKMLIELQKKIPFVNKVIYAYEQIGDKYIARARKLYEDSIAFRFQFIRERTPEPILEEFMIGNPDDGVMIEGNYCSVRSLGYHWLYCDILSHIDFSNIQSILELGSGYGGQAEIILRKHPHIRYVAMDIPPWLYIAELYLKALFPNEVIGYRETRKIDSETSLLNLMKDKRIAIVPPWKSYFLVDQFDLFWNSKSVQEMNENAKHHISLIAKKCDHAFFHVYKVGEQKLGLIHPPEYINEIVANLGFKEVMRKECSIAYPPASESVLYTQK